MQQEAMGKQGENVAAAEIADFEADLLVKQAEARKRAEVAQRIATPLLASRFPTRAKSAAERAAIRSRKSSLRPISLISWADSSL